jgi:hypothetical protein
MMASLSLFSGYAAPDEQVAGHASVVEVDLPAFVQQSPGDA